MMFICENIFFKCLLFTGLLFFGDAILMDDIIEWNIFKHKYSKSYKTFEEDVHHMVNFIEHKHKIDAHNQQYENGMVSFRMSLNKYSDLSHEEFVSRMNGVKHFHDESNQDSAIEGASDFISSHVELPASVDWREKGAVTHVKDQGQCGSCWAFSATGALEGQHFRKTGQLLSFSEQNLVDCNHANFGCSGGYPEKAFQYVMSGGIETENAYPYIGMNEFCKSQMNSSATRVTGFVAIPTGDEESLKEAISTKGPISIVIDASQPSFHHYHSGIYYEPDCRTVSLDHAVLVVGYGTDEHERDYYIVKNSWGEDWGENGYFRLTRNHHNHCGIATLARYPLI